ncbi:MAG: hypothetical protein D4R65_09080 [Verrucomicrobiaceae bacterium]|nr:MAG: hypothetical protein D4R65_09080 [Verrucomicrobiaceae bacterium]
MTKNTASAIILLIFADLSFQSAHAAPGLLLYTAGGSPYVNAVQYETFSSPSAHLSYVTVKGGQKMQVKSDGIIGNIPYPSSGAQVDQEEASGWIAQTEMFAGRYPQYAKLLQGVGGLWKRAMEDSKASAAQPASMPVVASSSPATGENLVSEGAKSEIPVLLTKSGKTLKNAKITRFEDGKAVMTYSDGMCRIALSDFGDLTGLPPDVKLAIEKANAAVEAQKLAEAERIAKEKQEKDRLDQIEQEKKRISAEAEEQRLAKLKQEQLERSEQRKKTDEVMARLAVAENQNPATTRSSQETVNDEDFYMQTLESVAREKNVDFLKNKSMYELAKQSVSSSDNPNDRITNDMFDDSLKNMRFSLKLETSSAGKELWVHCFTTLLAMSARGHNRASFEIGSIYDQGAGVKKNPEMAQKWLQKAAGQGSEDANKQLLKLGFTKSSPKSSVATRGFQETNNDDNGLLDSEAFAGFVDHYHGSEVRHIMSSDKLNKLPTIFKLAQSGNADAQYVAFLHNTLGIGVEKNPSQGFLWLQKSAAGGNANAQVNLAFTYLAGVNAGVQKDPTAARQWAGKAAAQGDKDAQSLVENLDKERAENASRSVHPNRLENESSTNLTQRNKPHANSGMSMSPYRREQLRKLNSPEYRKQLIEEATSRARGNPATALMSERSIENMVDKSIADSKRMAENMTDEEIQRQGGL